MPEPSYDQTAELIKALDEVQRESEALRQRITNGNGRYQGYPDRRRSSRLFDGIPNRSAEYRSQLDRDTD